MVKYAKQPKTTKHACETSPASFTCSETCLCIVSIPACGGVLGKNSAKGRASLGVDDDRQGKRLPASIAATISAVMISMYACERD